MKNERSLTVEAVVLRHNDWGEADRLLVLFTREQGKLRAVAKGARKLRSRKAGHLEPFTRVSLQLARGRDLWIVTQAQTVAAYLPMREDLVRVGSAYYIMELLDRFTYEEGENRALYQLVTETLERVDAAESLFAPVHYYEVRLLELLGFRPELFYCVHCHAKIKAEDQFFSPLEGGVLCPKDGQQTNNLWPVSMLALKFLRHYQRSSYEEAQRAEIPAPIQTEIENLLRNYLTYLLERGLNSPAFLRSVRNGS